MAADLSLNVLSLAMLVVLLALGSMGGETGAAEDGMKRPSRYSYWEKGRYRTRYSERKYRVPTL